MKSVESQLTDTILMIEPSYFGLNIETKASNAFQPTRLPGSEVYIRHQAKQEFQAMEETLRTEDVRVIACPSVKGISTPDAVFPNNWVSFHPDRVVLYPMLAPNRRQERQLTQVTHCLKESGVSISPNILDLSKYEEKNHFLEGTGSLILDRVNKVAFANISPRTTPELLTTFCEEMGYTSVVFNAVDKGGSDIYHTNVLMSLGREFAVLCWEAIRDPIQRKIVKETLDDLGKKVIDITYDQLYSFCGNILQILSTSGETKIVMSLSAYNAFKPEQKKALSQFGKLVPVDIATIETIGGGSARCMMAEVFS